MLRRLAFPLVATAALACGEAFTTGPNDGGPSSGQDGPVTVGPVDGAVLDASVEDVRAPRDAASRDAVTDDVTAADGPAEPVDASPVQPEATPCARACPSGFECILGKCQDRADTHFSAANDTSFNWSYGYFQSLGDMFQLDTFAFSPARSIDAWTNTMDDTLEPSVFHNASLLTQTYKGMTLAAGLLGLYPGAADEVSVVRWTAPVAGTYAITATFTGISTPMTTVTTGVLVKSIAGLNGSGALNKYGGGNTFMYSNLMQTLAAGDAVDFYVETIQHSDDEAGGVGLDARFTAE